MLWNNNENQTKNKTSFTKTAKIRTVLTAKNHMQKRFREHSILYFWSEFLQFKQSIVFQYFQSLRQITKDTSGASVRTQEIITETDNYN